MKKSKKEKKENNKEKFGTKFINIIKKRWLISGTNTLILIAILIAAFILINSIIGSLELNAIDCTSNKEYTLTDESKERVKDISSVTSIYFVGYNDSDVAYTLAKQYNKVNENIQVEIVDLTQRTDLAQKYNVTSEISLIIVENGDKGKIITSDELYTYDASYNTIDITEEKITSAILNVTAEIIPKVYFLTGYTDYTLQNSMMYFSQYLENEVLEYDNLDLLVSQTVPEDCNALAIMTPSRDFDEVVTNAIISYIQKGGKILWLNSAYGEKQELTNVNRILAEYGVNGFEVGYVYETEQDNTALGYQSAIIPILQSTEITSNLQSEKVLLLNATKINVDEQSLESKNVEKTDLITSSDTTYFRSNISNVSTDTQGDIQGSFILGAQFDKTITPVTENDEEIKSTLILLGENNFISDIQVTQDTYPMVYIYNNKDLVLNSIAYLTENSADITIRKDYTAETTYEPTGKEDKIIKTTIFAVPVLIIVVGIIVWVLRKYKK